MRKVLLILFVFCSIFANAAKVVVKGCNGPVYIYNSDRGEGRRYFQAENPGNIQNIEIPEEQCRDLLYFITDEKRSWMRVLPGETVEVMIGENDLEFAGDEAEINNYLYHWTQSFYFGKQNALLYRVQVMMSVIPMSKRGMPDVKEFYTAEYMQWVAGLKDCMLEDLRKAKLKDRNFVREQQQRINYAWIELQLSNYQVAKNVGEIPAEAMKFIREVQFDDISLLKYPGCSSVLNGYMDMAMRSGMIKFRAAEYLRAQAELIKEPQIREDYILKELFLLFTMRNLLYQGDLLLNSVEGLIISEEGKKKFQACRQEFEKLKATDAAGQQAVDFAFESYRGDTLCLQQFKGKFLFIDIWATWCTPCKGQIPYLKKLEKTLEGKPIQFLSVSADVQANKARWKSLVQQLGLENGNCAIAPDAFKHPMFEKYKVKAIPHFVLIDPEGTVIMSSARFPSDPLLKIQLDELLP